jgi:hypothetical protein
MICADNLRDILEYVLILPPICKEWTRIHSEIYEKFIWNGESIIISKNKIIYPKIYYGTFHPNCYESRERSISGNDKWFDDVSIDLTNRGHVWLGKSRIRWRPMYGDMLRIKFSGCWISIDELICNGRVDIRYIFVSRTPLDIFMTRIYDVYISIDDLRICGDQVIVYGNTENIYHSLKSFMNHELYHKYRHPIKINLNEILIRYNKTISDLSRYLDKYR